MILLLMLLQVKIHNILKQIKDDIMARKVLDSVTTRNDAMSIMNSIVGKNPQLNNRIQEVSDKSNLFLCEILKYYPYSDKVLVRILDSKRTHTCYLSHEVLGENIGFYCMPDGVMTSDSSKNYSSCLEPNDKLYGIVADVRWSGTSDEKVLLSCINLNDSKKFKQNVSNGEICLTVGNSSISITNQRINIKTPEVFVNGLPYSAPELTNYVKTTEANIKDNTYNILLEQLTKRLDNLVEENNLSEENLD